MTVLWIDLETYSEVDLKKHGTDRYARDCEIMLFGYAFNDEPAVDVDFTAGGVLPKRVTDALLDDRVELVAQNSFFDRTVMRERGFPTERERWRDTMVQAYAHSLPGALAKLGPIVGLPLDEQKDKDGKALVQIFCKPAPKGHAPRRRTRLTHPEEWERFRAYCRQDVEAMRSVRRKLPKWNYQGRELALWHLDQKINDRGFMVDTELATAAIRAGDRALKSLAGQVDDITMGDVASATKRDALLKHIVEYYGVTLPDMKADTLKRRVEDPELPDAVRQLLRVRLEASMTTKAKYAVLTRHVSPDGRLRNALQFCGAMRTGRWSGKGFQPHNMKRPNMKLAQIELGIAAMKADCEDLIFPNVMSLTANTARSCIIAPPGRKLVVADLSNIEGRGLAFLAGEEWKLQAFRDFDAGIGHDLYKVAYARSFNVDAGTVGDSSDERQIGKVQELALGYAGGVGAFIAFAMVYNIDLEDMARAVLDTLPGDMRHDAEGMWGWACKKQRTLGLSKDVYVACEALKRMWRGAHRAVVAFWEQLSEAAILATQNPGVAFRAGDHIAFQRDGVWLRMRLPSGRCLCYVKPEVSGGQLSYMGVNQYTWQWARIRTHGGKLAGNATQAFARDVLADPMPDVEAAGYDLILTVHDEILTETPNSDDFNAGHLSEMMTAVPVWAQGLPLAAKGFEGARYRKD